MHKDRPVSIRDLERAALQRLAPPVSEHFNQGARDGLTTADAVAAWDRLRLRPRMLRDVSGVSTATTILGHELAAPVCVAPMAMQRAAHPAGEVATARAVVASGSLMAVSTNSGTTFEEIGATGVRWWLQAYVLRDRGLTRTILERGRDAGASAVVLTVDTPVVGEKYTAGPSIYDVVPAEYMLANLDDGNRPDADLDKADDLTPDIIEWLRDVTGLPVVVKGVLRGDDARALVAAGASAVQVSNHGGRQLDQAVATADALPEVAAALAGTGTEIYVDGGIRRAEHVLAALALGARAVFVGRPILWALAAGGPAAEGGAAGVTDLLDGLGADLRHVMMLAGVRSPDEISSDLVAPPSR
jgi:4-hydroxymandelate oxidase